MAKNWTMKEAMEAVNNGDKEGMLDLGRRFPLTAIALAKGDMSTIINALPDHITARKIEAALKDGVVEASDDESDTVEAPVEETVKEKPAKKEKAEKKPAKAKKEEPMNEPVDEEETESDDYSEMTAVDLFKLCKKRGIKAEPKKKAADYIKLLKADDAKSNDASAAEDDEDDDWDI